MSIQAKLTASEAAVDFLKKLNTLVIPSEKELGITKKQEDISRKELLEYEYAGLKNDELKALIVQLKQDISERKRYANRIFCLICIWLGIDIILVVVNGLKWLTISDALMITIFTTTTANVLGLMILVIRYLFNSHKLNK